MRCSKCGKISFDYLESCTQCGHDLREIRSGLGTLPWPNPELSWFELAKAPPSSPQPAAASLPEAGGGPVGLTPIDVSDLVLEPEEAQESIEEIDLYALKAAAEDEAFQEALTDVLHRKPPAT